MIPQDDVNALRNIVNRMHQFIKQFDDNALADLCTFTKQITMLPEVAREELRNRCKVRPINGWILSLQKGTREIRDFNAAFRVFADVMSQQEFDNCCSLSLTKLERIFTDYMMARNPGMTPDYCKHLFNERTAPLITYRPARETLVRTI